MTPKLAPHEITIDTELALDFIHLGKGDLALGLRVARAAALDLAGANDPRSTSRDPLLLRHLRAAETVAETTKELLGHVKRFELERRRFLDEAARSGASTRTVRDEPGGAPRQASRRRPGALRPRRERPAAPGPWRPARGARAFGRSLPGGRAPGPVLTGGEDRNEVPP